MTVDFYFHYFIILNFIIYYLVLSIILYIILIHCILNRLVKKPKQIYRVTKKMMKKNEREKSERYVIINIVLILHVHVYSES